MDISKEEIVRLQSQFSTLYDFLHSIICCRKIGEAINDGKVGGDFWVVSKNSCLQMAAILWCRVFGTNSQDSHWVKTIQRQDDFRKEIYRQTGLDYESYNKYWREMVSFRNNYVAHINPEEVPGNVPSFDAALTVVIAAHKWLRTQMNGYKILYNGPADIDLYIENVGDDFENQITGRE